MVLTLFKLDASPPVRSVYMTIEALQIPDVEMVDVNVLEGAHLKEDYLTVQNTLSSKVNELFMFKSDYNLGYFFVSELS